MNDNVALEEVVKSKLTYEGNANASSVLAKSTATVRAQAAKDAEKIRHAFKQHQEDQRRISALENLTKTQAEAISTQAHKAQRDEAEWKKQQAQAQAKWKAGELVRVHEVSNKKRASEDLLERKRREGRTGHEAPVMTMTNSALVMQQKADRVAQMTAKATSQAATVEMALRKATKDAG